MRDSTPPATPPKFYTFRGWLFCNTLFVPEGTSEEIPFGEVDHDYTRSSYRIAEVTSFNVCDVPFTTSIKFGVLARVIDVPFHVIAAMVSSPEDEGMEWENEQEFYKTIKKKK